MPYYRIRPYCGAHLDPGERCDCAKSREDRAKDLIAPLTVGEKLQLLELLKNIPASDANTDRDGVEQIETTASTTMISEKERICKHDRRFFIAAVSHRQRGSKPAQRRPAAQ